MKKKQKIHNVYIDVFISIGFFKGTSSLQVKDDIKPYKTQPRCIAYALQEPLKEELES